MNMKKLLITLFTTSTLLVALTGVSLTYAPIAEAGNFGFQARCLVSAPGYGATVAPQARSQKHCHQIAIKCTGNKNATSKWSTGSVYTSRRICKLR